MIEECLAKCLGNSVLATKIEAGIANFRIQSPHQPLDGVVVVNRK